MLRLCSFICGAVFFVSTAWANSSEADCNFDVGFCGWRPGEGSVFSWTRQTKRTPSQSTGPQDENYKGHYIFIEASSPRRRGDKAILTSPHLSGVRCMRFSYHMFGANMGSLTVIISHGKMQTMLWSEKGNHGRQWKAANVTVYGKNYTVSLMGTVGESYTSDAAVDDVSFVSGPCNGEKVVGAITKAEAQNGSCPFDFGLCEWENDQLGDSTDWAVSRYPSRTTPNRDHGGHVGGKYAYFDGSRIRRGRNGQLISKPLCATRCLQFYYHMSGQYIGGLNIYKTVVDHSEDADRIVALSGAQGDAWKEHMVELNADSDQCYRLSIEGVSSGYRSQGRIAIDDVLITEGNCCSLATKAYNTEEKVRCDFDRDFCQWRNSPQSDFSWTWGTGPTTSGATGPDTDASGTGGYAFIEASEPQYRGQKAILASVSSLSGTWCMRFKYHMYGGDVGSLMVYRNNEIVWSLSGDHGNQWHQGYVDIDCSHMLYQISIAAKVGAGWRGDIAIDEIEFATGKCPVVNDTQTTKPGQPLIPQAQGETCTFETSFCNWFNSADDDFDWVRHSGETPSEDTGPSYDYDGTGTYVYIEASGKRPTQLAKLSSKVLSGQTCLKFHYLMRGKFVAELKVEVWDTDTDTKEIVWSKVGEQGSDWLLGSVDLNGTNYKVSFVGVRGLSFKGDIALDVISTSPGLCSDNVASYILDAAYKVNIGNCDFDAQDLCNWKNENQGDVFDWRLGRGSTPSQGTGPNGGEKTDQDYYAFIEASSPRRLGDTARLSLGLPPIPIVTCLQLDYNMYGATIGSLRIYWSNSDKKSGHEKKLCELKGNKGNKWGKLQVNIPGRASKLIIEAVRGRDYTGDIAIDNLMLSKGSCKSGRWRCPA